MRKILTMVMTGLIAGFMTVTSANDEEAIYEVTITNLTQAQKFTPILVASHKKDMKLFRLGHPASPELTDVAEGGAIGGLADMLMINPNVVDVADSFELLPPNGLLEPGQSVTVTVSADGAKYLSLASMLIPTNDAFIALNSVRVKGSERVFQMPAYDAGTETNDENCAHIPGPDCGGIPFSPDDAGEGYVYIHGGIHGIGDLDAEIYDWRNPVAHVEIVKVK